MTSFADARSPEGMRLYAIGDVHGCLEDLRRIHEWILDDLDRRPRDDWRVVHVGDFIDRGPDSPGVMEHMIECSAADSRMLSVRGNQDQYLLDFMESPLTTSFSRWARYDGATTISNYGVAGPVDPEGDVASRMRLHEMLEERIPASHTKFVAALSLSLRFGDYLFVHAGLWPGVPLNAQSERDLMWIREPFLSSTADHWAIVVHGHTHRPEIVVRENGIAIDTGCVFGGTLSCVVLEDNDKHYLLSGRLEPLPSPSPT